MSQFIHAPVQLVRSHLTIALSWLLALVAAVAIVLILAIGSDSTDEPASAGIVQSQTSVRPEESDVAAAVTHSGTSGYDSHPDEASVAAAVSGR